MKCVSLAPLLAAMLCTQVARAGDTAPPTGGASGSSIPYSTLQVIDKDDSPALVVEKAAKVLPRPNQTAWMRLERTFFIHQSHHAITARTDSLRDRSLQTG